MCNKVGSSGKTYNKTCSFGKTCYKISLLEILAIKKVPLDIGTIK
jgi:hypothetical protein